MGEVNHITDIRLTLRLLNWRDSVKMEAPYLLNWELMRYLLMPSCFTSEKKLEDNEENLTSAMDSGTFESYNWYNSFLLGIFKRYPENKITVVSAGV